MAAVLTLDHAGAQNATQYQYDALGRLTSVTSANGAQTQYQYDAAGNRTSLVANGAPVAVADSATTLSNAPVTLDPRSNDSDPEGGALSVTQVSAAANGTASINAGGVSVTFTPAANFVGTGSFSYRVSDPQGAFANATVTVTVQNRPPIAANDTVSVSAPAGVTFNPRTNDSDPETGALTLISVSTPTSGTAQLTNSNTTITYTPPAGAFSGATFTYTISDPLGAQSSATVTVTVNNQPPIANADSATTLSNAAVTTSVLANDSDPEGGALTLVSVQNAINGAATVSGNNAIFTPSTNFVGTGSYTYTVRDPQNATATATVTVTVQNRPPVAVADAVSTLKNTAVTFDPRTNDSDPEGGALTIVGVAGAANGTAAVSGGGTTVTFTPNAGYTGAASFTYTVQDTLLASASATVSVTVTPPPVEILNPSRTVSSNANTTFTLADLATVTSASTIESWTPSIGGGSIAPGGQSANYNAPRNDWPYCDFYSENIDVTIPYTIRHTATGNIYSGTASVTVLPNIGPPPNGGCP